MSKNLRGRKMSVEPPEWNSLYMPVILFLFCSVRFYAFKFKLGH